MWNISGEPIASLNTTPDQSNQIFCVSMSTLCDWDPDHVIITGGSDGVVRMWGLDYIREDLEASETPAEGAATSDTAKVSEPPRGIRLSYAISPFC
ncbi:unnamed protein product [Dibothriocephalus latus]|uniref:Uncharacterized protein n=1 Tax=Dibothriocephalus latus TaxID=60516 RepID=A0A3P7N5D8_DIBLA|nr:unnamed protein product [Dibothriocephalus latus]